MRTRDKWIIGLAAVAAALAVVRLALPTLVTDYANSRLAAVGEYSGHVASVDIDLVRGAYAIHGLRIVKPGVDSQTPFFEVDRIDMSLEWAALLDARVVGRMALYRPELNLVLGGSARNSQLGSGVNWPAKVQELFPFDFDEVRAEDGLVTFRAPGIETDESLTLRNARIIVRNLANVERKGDAAFAELDLTGDIMGNAPVSLSGRIDPNSDTPTFDLDLTLRDARLVDVNPWLRRFLSVDAEQGVFSMYTELAAADGRFDGYVKPILEDADLFEIDERGDNLLRKAWEALVDLAANALENREERQVATRIPLSGELENPEADVLSTIVNLFRNAFVSAFTHAVEGTVTLHDVRTDADG